MKRRREQIWAEQSHDTVIAVQSKSVVPERGYPIDKTQAGLTGFGQKAEVPLCAKCTQAVLPHTHLRPVSLVRRTSRNSFSLRGPPVTKDSGRIVPSFVLD